LRLRRFVRQDLTEAGLDPDAAADAAIRRFGNIAAVASECRRIDTGWYRATRRTLMWSDLRQDVGYGARLLVRAPGFTMMAVITLALGIGATTAIFSVVDAALLRPLPYPDPERLVEIQVEQPQGDGSTVALGPSVPDMEAWRRDGQVFSHLAIWHNGRPVMLDAAEPERVEVMQISEEYLGLHGVSPLLGRGFEARDAKPGADPVALLGHAFWRTRFGGDPGVVNRILRLGNEAVTVVGVLPAGFYTELQIWRAYPATAMGHRMRGSGSTVYGRLRPGVSLEQAERRLADLTAAYDREHWQGRAAGVAVESLYARTTADYITTTNILLAAVFSILIIACINVAGLLLARGATRRPEMAIRASIGAGRFRLLRQLLTESLVLSACGGVAGVLVAWMALDALVANIPLRLPANAPVALNLRVLAFAMGLSLTAGILFGLLPALKLSRASVSGALARADRRHGSGLTRRGGQILIATEVALALVLLAGAGLMIRSFARILSVDVGFDPDRIVTMEVIPVNPDAAVMKAYYPSLVASLRTLPGIDAVGAVDNLPLGGSSSGTSAVVDGKKLPVKINEFVAGYFEAIGFELLEGRVPAPADGSGDVGVSILNEQAAKYMFPNVSPVGRRFQIDKVSYHVLGVVADIRHKGPLMPAVPEVYLSFGHHRLRPMIVMVRSQIGGPALHTQLREAARAVGPRVVVERIRHGSDWLDDRIVTPRHRAVLLGLLGSLALLLTLVGVSGMTAYAVARRTQEIGVRMAFGASPAQVVRTMLRDSLLPVAAGIIVGLGGAVLATRVIASFLFETPPAEPSTLAAVAAMLAVAACAAAWIPARRAALVDPVAALRAE
jgi:predicted permease